MVFRSWVFVVLIILTASYFFYQGRGIIFPPPLFIYTPEDGETFYTSQIKVSGRSLPDVAVWIAGKEVKTDGEGNFEEVLILNPGFHNLGIYAEDDFGEQIRRIVRIVVK